MFFFVVQKCITHRVFEFEFYSKTALLSLAFSLHVFSLFSKTHVFADDVVIIFSITLWPSFWLVDLPCLDMRNRASSIPQVTHTCFQSLKAGFTHKVLTCISKLAWWNLLLTSHSITTSCYHNMFIGKKLILCKFLFNKHIILILIVWQLDLPHIFSPYLSP